MSIYNTPTLSKEFDNPQGVPISAIIFGGRRTQLIPLVVESLDWRHGVFLGARMGSETTAAAAGQVGVVRRDPLAMLPFCGYNLGTYFRHWLNMGNRLTRRPKIFSVNWFRTDDRGRFIWPGFGENMRVLKGIIDRVHDTAGARETPAGLVPRLRDLEIEGINVSKKYLAKLFEVNMGEWGAEVDEFRNFLLPYRGHLPPDLWEEYNLMERHIRVQK